MGARSRRCWGEETFHSALFFFLPQYHLLNSLPALKIRININGEEVEQITISSPLGNMRLNRKQMLTRREGEKRGRRAGRCGGRDLKNKRLVCRSEGSVQKRERFWLVFRNEFKELTRDRACSTNLLV